MPAASPMPPAMFGLDRGITTCDYTYDFGDDWRHSITVEAVTDADPAAEYPRFVDGERSENRN